MDNYNTEKKCNKAIEKAQEKIEALNITIDEKKEEISAQKQLTVKLARNIKRLIQRYHEKQKCLEVSDILDERERKVKEQRIDIEKREKVAAEQLNILTAKFNEVMSLKKQVDDFNEQKGKSFFIPNPTEEELFNTHRPVLLNAICEYGSVAGALRNCLELQYTNLKLRTVNYYKDKFPLFQADITMAMQIYTDERSAALDEAVFDRAINGTEKPFFSAKGDFIGDHKVKNDTLLLKAAETLNPDKYRAPKEAKVDKTKQQQHAINVQINNFDKITAEMLGTVRNIGVVSNIDDEGNILKTLNKRPMLLEDLTLEGNIIDV